LLGLGEKWGKATGAVPEEEERGAVGEDDPDTWGRVVSRKKKTKGEGEGICGVPGPVCFAGLRAWPKWSAARFFFVLNSFFHFLLWFICFLKFKNILETHF
jgi:hypothetical protein